MGTSRQRSDPLKIAVIGMAGQFPGANSPEELWENLAFGKESISIFAREELVKEGVPRRMLDLPQYVPVAPVLKDVDCFDASFFGYTPREAEIMDPQQRLFLETAWSAVEHAGYDPAHIKCKVGVFAGSRSDTYLVNLLSHSDLVQALGAFHIGLGNDLAFLTSRVSHCLDLKGPSCSVHTACSTSLVAMHLACESLILDDCKMALAGGVTVNVPHNCGYVYEDGSVFSPDGHCRVFDANARGTVFGSGVGMVVLKRLEDALADGDCIHAVILGSAVNNDGGLKSSFTAPGVRGQVQVIRSALVAAGLNAESVS